ncbi:immunity 50 family protein [Burkholderia multivorans]|uniref:Imm50 family immunity protein n=1 Tax=Burkholderia multivorans TaxID=87883 RepID=UPI000CFFE96D|nr:Imm50 family immunity protein [Burkholderia multivorans]MCO1357116.1 immunity 50 family protein [Burkholderia multivorans]MCO1448618.1 immunity 50 family protein [Burkholderia multivorans]PRE26646.1 hypothetical protein C6P79_16760 [Burkholderia multivorans]UQP42529.1 immunity 50 family protein [Burkholderia multivorans]
MGRGPLYAKTFRYVRQNARRLPYDIGYSLTRRDDGTYIYGYEIVRESYSGRAGAGAVVLDFFGSPDDAERHLIKKLEQIVETLPEALWEADREAADDETDERAVVNASDVTRIFGYWPRFHDAELIAVALRRVESAGGAHTDMELTVRAVVRRDDDDRARQWRITFLFEHVDGSQLSTEDVACRSWIHRLRFSRCDDGRVQIDLFPSTGFDIRLNCRTASVTRVDPY